VRKNGHLDVVKYLIGLRSNVDIHEDDSKDDSNDNIKDDSKIVN
jgi:hypothetical protein